MPQPHSNYPFVRRFVPVPRGIRSEMFSTEYTLPPSPSSARAARDWSRGHISDWGDAASRHAVLLLISELVTNAVLHARSELTIHLIVTDEMLRVQVDDASPEAPVRRHAQHGMPGGRGLQLLDALSEQWGVRTIGAGKAVWFEICHEPTG